MQSVLLILDRFGLAAIVVPKIIVFITLNRSIEAIDFFKANNKEILPKF
jgi:hypothetical protein